MQTLEVISINIWQILISLANLTILFLVLKHFLFKPVKKVLAARQAEIDARYSEAKKAEDSAQENKQAWEEKMQGANDSADEIIKSASESANRRGESIIAEAREKAEGIVRQAKSEAELEKKKAQDEVKREIVEVSTALAEKMLEREINAQDHRNLIDSFIKKIGDDSEK